MCYKRLSRAIQLYIFSRPASAQFADCITCLATNHFVSVWADNCLSASSLFYIYIHFLVWICLNMFRFWASSICLFSIPVCPHRLRRAIYQYIFSRLADVHFADCITCLTTNYFVSIWEDNCISASSLVLYIHAFF